MAQSPSEIAEIFRSSEVFYCYENSALSLEAALCGCPVVLLPNKYFKEMIALDELGRDGMAWGQSPAEVQRARDTVDRVYSNYQSLVQQFLSDLDRFIELTQKRAAQAAYRKEIDRVRLAFDSAQSRGAVPSAKAIPRSLFKQTFIAVSVAAILISEVGITGFVKKIFKAIRQGGIATLRNRARGIYNRT